MTPSSLATAQPSRPTRSTSTSSGSSSWPSTRKRPPSSSSNSPARERARAPRAAPRRASGRARGRFGFTRSSEASTSPNSTSFTRSSSAISSAWPPARRAPATTSRRSGWRSLSPERRRAPGGRARRPAGRRRSRRAAPRRARPTSGQPARKTDAGPSAHEVPPEVVGEERHHRRDHAQRLHERVPERRERRLVVLARSAGASGGCTSSRGRRRTPRTRAITSTVSVAS